MDDPDLELVVTMLNINLGKNKKVIRTMPDLKGEDLCEESTNLCKEHEECGKAVCAVTECINEGILREFLLPENRKRGSVEMSIFEYDEEAVFEIVRKDEERTSGRSRKGF